MTARRPPRRKWGHYSKDNPKAEYYILRTAGGIAIEVCRLDQSRLWRYEIAFPNGRKLRGQPYQSAATAKRAAVEHARQWILTEAPHFRQEWGLP